MAWLTNQLKVGALFASVGVTVLICVLTVFGAIILEARERMIQETQAAMIELFSSGLKLDVRRLSHSPHGGADVSA